MRNLILGLVVGTGLGYVFHDDIDRALRDTAKKANEALNNDETPDGQDPLFDR
jgi:hypothetical protein